MGWFRRTPGACWLSHDDSALAWGPFVSQRQRLSASLEAEVTFARANQARVSDLRAIAVVGGGAALGGIARYFVNSLASGRWGASAAPLATACINVSGSFLIGLLAGMLATRPGLSPLWRLFVATGILGGYTTFSTFALDALGLAGGGAVLSSVAYVVGSVVLGIAAAFCGTLVARAF